MRQDFLSKWSQELELTYCLPIGSSQATVFEAPTLLGNITANKSKHLSKENSELIADW